MSPTTVVFHLTDDELTSCTLATMGGRTIGRVTPHRPLAAVLPPGTHVLRVRCAATEHELDLCVADVPRQDVHLVVVAGELSVGAAPSDQARLNCSHCTS